MLNARKRAAVSLAPLLVGVLALGCNGLSLPTAAQPQAQVAPAQPAPTQAQPAAQAGATTAPAQPAAPGAKGREGGLDEADCKAIAGWAWDKSQPDAALKLNVYDGGTLLGTVDAGKPRADLA